MACSFSHGRREDCTYVDQALKRVWGTVAPAIPQSQPSWSPNSAKPALAASPSAPDLHRPVDFFAESTAGRAGRCSVHNLASSELGAGAGASAANATSAFSTEALKLERLLRQQVSTEMRLGYWSLLGISRTLSRWAGIGIGTLRHGNSFEQPRAKILPVHWPVAGGLGTCDLRLTQTAS